MNVYFKTSKPNCTGYIFMKNIKINIAIIAIFFASSGANAGTLTANDFLAVSSQAKTMCVIINEIHFPEDKIGITVKTNINLLIEKLSTKARGKYVNHEDRSVLIYKISEMLKDSFIENDRCVLNTVKLLIDSLKISKVNGQIKKIYNS